ncbi:FecR domain-containing protein [Pseudoduganella plicata]|nr:FecR domain-containing protein [Pseudoduganella plicata]GGY97153.1 sensor [Pseudoduganella plicata]
MNETRNDAQIIEEEAARWLACQDAGTLTGAMQEQFDTWLEADTRHRVAWLRLRAAWTQADSLLRREAANGAQSAALPRFSQWRIAAGVLLAIALGAQLMWMSGGTGPQQYATRIGENRVVALADGSRIMLNTDSRLRAAPDAARKVWLDRGEAYFDIAHDPAHPFIVEAGDSRVTVLGTRFTVRRTGAGVRVLVAEGRVRVTESGAAVTLTRNEEAVALGGRIARATRTEAQTGQRLAWREGRIVFDQTRLADAAAEFNRYNERRIVVADPDIAGIRIGGSFSPANVDGFARLLEQGFGLTARRDGNDILISR